MDPALEESARVHGAPVRGSVRDGSPCRWCCRRCSAAALLVFVQAMGLFSVPAVLGMPGGFYVAGTEIYRLLNTYPPRLGAGGRVGLVAAGRHRRAGLAAGRGAGPALLRHGHRQGVPARGCCRSGAARWLLAVLAWAYVGLAVVLPVRRWSGRRWSISSRSTRADAFDLQPLPLRAVQLSRRPGWRPRNSVMLGVLAATAIARSGLGIGWVVVRRRGAVRARARAAQHGAAGHPVVVLALGVLWTYVGLEMAADLRHDLASC